VGSAKPGRGATSVIALATSGRRSPSKDPHSPRTLGGGGGDKGWDAAGGGGGGGYGYDGAGRESGHGDESARVDTETGIVALADLEGRFNEAKRAPRKDYTLLKLLKSQVHSFAEEHPTAYASSATIFLRSRSLHRR